jgi:ABC-2 type transport system ATP-binding protein
VTLLGFDVVSHGALRRVSAAFAGGAHVVLGEEADGTAALIELAAGLALPRVGRVTVDGQEPFLHAPVRRRVAALCAEERLPSGRTVTTALSLALRARGDARSSASVLDAAGLSHFAARRTGALGAREVRAVSLALALTHPEPAWVALFEPLALLDLVDEACVLHALARFAETGAVVLCTANRLEDGARLGGAVSTLERGIWLDPAASRVTPARISLRVLSPDAERLAARLAEAPAIVAVEWAGRHELVVRGADLERVAAHVVASARSAAISIDALRCDPPSLAALARARAEQPEVPR